MILVTDFRYPNVQCIFLWCLMHNLYVIILLCIICLKTTFMYCFNQMTWFCNVLLRTILFSYCAFFYCQYSTSGELKNIFFLWIGNMFTDFPISYDFWDILDQTGQKDPNSKKLNSNFIAFLFLWAKCSSKWVINESIKKITY